MGAGARLSVFVGGGLGDHLLSARFLRDMLKHVGGNVSFDVHTSRPSIAHWMFSAIPGFSRAIETEFNVHGNFFSALLGCYDYRVDLMTYLSIKRGRGGRRHGKIEEILKRCELEAKAIEPYIKAHPLLDGALGHHAAYKGRTRHDYLHSMAGIDYVSNHLYVDCESSVLAKHGLVGTQYITVHNGYDEHAAFASSDGTSTKVYRRLNEVISGLKRQRPDIKVVQLGATTSSLMAEADLNLINRTTLREAAAILRGATFHVDNESGLVHLATAIGTKCCVVFGPTLAEYFGYPSNINIKPKACGGCWWTERNWMARCPKNQDSPECMASHSPDEIGAAILRAL